MSSLAGGAARPPLQKAPCSTYPPTGTSSATPSSLFPRAERRASLSAFLEGFSLHAATRVMASNRRGIWRLCAYGDRGALALLRAARDNGPLDEPATSLLFNLQQDAADDEGHGERLALCDHGLRLATRPVTRSSWHLRRGTLHAERGDRAAALVDLQMVLKLKASDEHAAQAHKPLLAVATMTKPPTKKRP
jgi:hypothetical protein